MCNLRFVPIQEFSSGHANPRAIGESIPAKASARENGPIRAHSSRKRQDVCFTIGTTLSRKWNHNDRPQREKERAQSRKFTTEARRTKSSEIGSDPIDWGCEKGTYFFPYSPPVAAASNELWSCLILVSSVIFLPSMSVT